MYMYKEDLALNNLQMSYNSWDDVCHLIAER